MQWKKEMESQQSVPPGYDPVDAKPKSKAAKRNERKKEKRLQAALEKGKNSEGVSDVDVENEESQSTEDLGHTSKSVEALTSQMKAMAVSTNSIGVTPPVDSSEASCPEPAIQDIDKRIRALKKKQQKNAAENAKPEQLEKFTKLEGWREELKLLESTRAEQVSS
ncbi:unnamed protein product [Linum tenue]|uniref:Partner of Y14 and mago n=1 Tax=Linum tenue TaxID=586396 RepID=A0AAV0LYP5_9ROSI|nr:unnamed protein product [Linum tenue]